MLRTGTSADAAAAAALHVSQISEGFLASLGPRFLGRLYRRVARVPDSFLLVLEAEGRTVGFLAGSVDVGALYKAFLVRDGARAVLDCARQIVTSPGRLLETFRHGTTGNRGEAELLAIAIDPAARGVGGGKLLVGGFLKEIARRGPFTADVVVASGNVRAIALYGRMGFEVTDRFELHRGSESILMQHSGSPLEESSR